MKIDLKIKHGFTLAEVFSVHPKDGRKQAFTLAEVLITLGIIGVVAAMTLPTLIQKHQKKVTVTQLKKAYTELAQAIQLAEVQFGELATWHTPKSAFNNDILENNKNFAENYLFPSIKTVNRCIPSSDECWSDDIVNLNGVSLYNTNYLSNSIGNRVSFVTVSGYSVFFWLNANGGGMWYWVDLNGPKKGPNKIGRDIFVFSGSWSTSNSRGVFPYGLDRPTRPTRESLINGSFEKVNYKCKFEPDETVLDMVGAYCGALIVLDGWKIADDYPWKN